MIAGMSDSSAIFAGMVSDRVMAYVTAEHMNLSLDETRAAKIIGLLSVQCLSDELDRLRTELSSCEPDVKSRLIVTRQFFECTHCPALQSSRRRLLEIVQKMVRENSRL